MSLDRFSSPHRATVASGFVSGMLAGLRARGIDAANVLRDAGIDATILNHPTARIPLDDYAALYNGVVRLLDDEGFGLFSTPVRCGMFEFLCRGMVGSRDLREALARAAGFLRVVLPDLALTVTNDGAHAALTIAEMIPIGTHAEDPRRIFAFEWILRLIHSLSCWLTRRSLPLDSVMFPYARPPHADDYALIYTAQPHFGGAHLAALLQPGLLDLPMMQDQDAIAAFLEGAPGKIAVLYRRDHEMVRQIREVLASSLLDDPSLDDIARHLHLSLRTVQRRLKQEGSSFRAIKSQLRRNVALALIEKGGDSVAEIAVALGYAESSAFFRAFVHWTGEAPTRYRRRLRDLSA